VGWQQAGSGWCAVDGFGSPTSARAEFRVGSAAFRNVNTGIHYVARATMGLGWVVGCERGAIERSSTMCERERVYLCTTAQPWVAGGNGCVCVHGCVCAAAAAAAAVLMCCEHTTWQRERVNTHTHTHAMRAPLFFRCAPHVSTISICVPLHWKCGSCGDTRKIYLILTVFSNSNGFNAIYESKLFFKIYSKKF
jgi:hypothetical protein